MHFLKNLSRPLSDIDSSSSGASSGKPQAARVSSSMSSTVKGLHADLWAGGAWPNDMSRSSA
jgi:hypothetical protein